MEQLEKEQAKKKIIAAVEEYDNIIAFGFKKNGEAVTITATDDPIYDKLALAIQKWASLEESSLPSNLDEAAREKARGIFDAHEKHDIGEEKNRILLGLLELEALAMMFYDSGAELMISELFEKLKITPLKVIGKDEYGYPVYDFEVGHYYRTFTLFGEKYKCDQTDSGKAGEQMLAGQGYTTETKVDRTPLNGPAGICINLHDSTGFKLGDRVIVQIRKKD